MRCEARTLRICLGFSPRRRISHGGARARRRQSGFAAGGRHRRAAPQVLVMDSMSSATRNEGRSAASVSRPVNALDRLAEMLAADMAEVNRLIVERMQSSVALIPQLAGYIVASGGKRLRPLLTLAAARLSGYRGTRQYGLAACVEFIHTATLLHDDVVDASEERRGQASANAVFGNEASVLVGDFLFSRAFQIMVADGSLEVLKILSDASAVIAEGEVLQLATQNNLATDEAGYLRVIEAKTAALFAAACEIGPVIAGRDKAEQEALRRYGLNLGIAFQIADDVLDYSAARALLGKTIGDDFREGKVSLPVVLAYGRAQGLEREFWRRTIERNEQREGDLDMAIQYLRQSRVLGECLDRARAYADAAKDALAALPEGELRQALLDAADFTVERQY
jgi:octaprenyl-diphosphate synthase